MFLRVAKDKFCKEENKKKGELFPQILSPD